MSTLRRVTRRRRPWWLILGPTAAVVALIVIVLGVAIVGITASLGAHAAGLTGGRPSSPPDCSGAPGGQPVPVTGSAPGLTAEQLGNAQAIAGVALGLGLGERGIQIGIVAALTESTLRNLNYGDYNSNGVMTTSRGLFQMKDAWGSLADRLDPTRAATIFYTIDKGPGVRGLLHIPGWQQMTVVQAAQAVEGSQFADGSNYLQNLAQAQAITTALLAGQPSVTASTTAAAAGPASAVVVPLPVAPVGGSCGSGPAPGAVYTPPGLQQNDSQDPATFGWVHGGALEPMVWNGHAFGQVAKGTAKLWTALLNELVPMIPGGLTNDLGCFEDRANVNNPSVLSFHAYGLACDLNSGVNCNGCSAQSLQGRQFALPMATHDVVAKYCMQWGGDFKGTPDPMHVEIHCTPTQIATWAATQP